MSAAVARWLPEPEAEAVEDADAEEGDSHFAHSWSFLCLMPIRDLSNPTKFTEKLYELLNIQLESGLNLQRSKTSALSPLIKTF